MRRHRKRLLAIGGISAALATGVVAVAVAGGGPSLSIATESTTRSISNRACGSGKAANLAHETPSGAKVFVGIASDGANCVVFEDANGTTVSTSAQVGATPAGRAIALKALDTSTGRYAIVVAVPDGYDTARTDNGSLAISNNIVVIDEENAPSTLDVAGSAGSVSINLAEFLK